jgi:hypothetical protein
MKMACLNSLNIFESVDILYDFKKYENPKKGIFRIETGDYKLPGGWVQKEETYIIIGETELWFIYRLQESGYGEWIGDKVIQHEYVLPVGIHKSRFVKWTDCQLALF